MLAPLVVMLDSNAYDHLADESDGLAYARAAAARGLVRFLSTHVQEDEIIAISDPERRAALLALPKQLIATAGFVLDVSRLDMARLSDDDSIYQALGGRGHAKDALIGWTAQTEGAVLVTEDRRLGNAAVRAGVTVMRPAAFLVELRRLVDTPGQ